MKQALLFLISLLTYINCTAQPAIFAAGEITYEHISDSTYTFYANLYQDCAGGKEPDTITACFNDPCDNTYSFTAKLAKTNNRGNVAQMGCSQYPTNCSEPDAVRGYRVWHYGATITLPAQCNSWHIAVMADTATRTLNLQPANFFAEIIFNNTGTNQNNSSPFFVNDAISYCESSIPFSFQNRPLDPDGDSLVTEISYPLTVDYQCSEMPGFMRAKAITPPLSLVSNPFPTNNTFSFDRYADKLSFTATDSGTAIIGLKTTEYRDGKMIGSILRNQVIEIVPYSGPVVTPLSIFQPSIINCKNCFGGGGRAEIFMNDTVSFDITVSPSFYPYPPDTRLLLEDGIDSIFPNAVVTYHDQNTKSPIGHFLLSPQIADTGIHYFLLKIVDTTCRPPGQAYTNYYSIAMLIYSYPFAAANSNTLNSNDAIFLYPNPNNGHFKLKGYESGMGKIALVNTMGQVIDADVKLIDTAIDIPRNIPAGVYALKIYKEGRMQTLPFVINR